MTAKALYERLYRDGFALRTDGTRLIVTPSSKISDELAGEIAANKDALITRVNTARLVEECRRRGWKVVARTKPMHKPGMPRLSVLAVREV